MARTTSDLPSIVTSIDTSRAGLIGAGKTPRGRDRIEGDFEAFVLRHGPELVRFARRLTLDHHRGEDVVQEVLARCSRSWHRIAKLDNPRAYLFRAVVNETNSWRRRRYSREYPSDELVDAGTGSVDGHADQLAEFDAARRMLATLTPCQRAVLVLRYYDGATDQQIAATLAMPTNTVRSHARRGLQKLRDIVAAIEEGGQP